MTIQYQGDDTYKVWLHNGGWIELTKEDLISMQDLEFEGSKVESLKEKVEEREEDLVEFSYDIDRVLRDFDNLFDDSDSDFVDFMVIKNRLSKISEQMVAKVTG